MKSLELPGIGSQLDVCIGQRVPTGYDHVRGRRAAAICRQVGIQHAVVVVGQNGDYCARLRDGVIVAQNDAAKLREELQAVYDANEYLEVADKNNKVNITLGVPRVYAHVPRQRLQRLCRSINVKCVNAVDDRLLTEHADQWVTG